jgi:hypothetical protein
VPPAPPSWREVPVFGEGQGFTVNWLNGAVRALSVENTRRG